MSSTLALNAVSTAIFGALNVASLLALAPGGVHDDVPQRTTQLFPFVLFVVSEDQQLGGFGTRPGVAGQLPEVGVRIHVFGQSTPGQSGLKQVQAVMAKVLELLSIAPSVTGYTSPIIFWDQTIPVGDEVVAGIPVKELVANGRFYAEAA